MYFRSNSFFIWYEISIWEKFSSLCLEPPCTSLLWFALTDIKKVSIWKLNWVNNNEFIKYSNGFLQWKYKIRRMKSHETYLACSLRICCNHRIIHTVKPWIELINFKFSCWRGPWAKNTEFRLINQFWNTIFHFQIEIFIVSKYERLVVSL